MKTFENYLQTKYKNKDGTPNHEKLNKIRDKYLIILENLFLKVNKEPNPSYEYKDYQGNISTDRERLNSELWKMILDITTEGKRR